MKTTRTQKTVLIAIFAALVFASNFISIPIPVAIGSVTRIHLANGICLLSSLILGPVGGGLAAGLGSGLYDLTNPVYISGCWITFILKFLLAYSCGLIAHSGGAKGNRLGRNITGSVAGSLLYIILYLAKTAIEGLIAGSAFGALIPALITKLGTSSVNAVIAVIIVAVLTPVIKAALKVNHFNAEGLSSQGKEN